MTREEAIRIIKIVLVVAEEFEITVQGEEFTKEKCKEAVEIVTKALQQEPCDDAISRQAAIDACLNGWNKDYKEIVEDIRALPPVTPTEKVGHWIPVSERLPEDKQSVLVWCPQYKNIYCAYLEKEQWWIFGAFVQIVPNEVVAWMPLPEPYKASPTGAESEG